MRNLYSFFVVLLFLSMLLIPLWAMGDTGPTETPTAPTDAFLIKTDDGIKTLSARDYVFGVVAAEMPALYPEEALKAQAVAAYTYAYRKRQNATGDYHLTDSAGTDQSYADGEAVKKKWGDHYEKYAQKVYEAVDSVLSEAVFYEGEPIFAAYHAISSGRTENAENVWGQDYPYLRSVSSVGDKLASGYLSRVTVTAAEFSEKLGCEGTLTLERYDTGYVKTLRIGEREFSGTEIRKKLSLRSACFSVEPTDGGYIFEVAGYGHGVGMSQQGARVLAEQGFSYREILLYYYADCEIKKRP